MRLARPIAFGTCVFVASAASADFIWPPVVLARGVSSWPVIATGLLVEFPFVRLAFRVSFGRAALATVAMNAASFALGFPIWRWIFTPLSNLAIPRTGAVAYPVATAETLFVWLGSIVASTVIELAVLRYFFGLPVPWRRSRWVLVANAVSTTLALVLAGVLAARGA